MSGIVIVGLVLLNLVISWWNAKESGRIWLESKAIGGFARVMAWCGAIMAGIGFTYCYSIIISVGLAIFGVISFEIAQYVLSLTYLLIIFPALGTGLLITIESWIRLYRERNLVNLGATAWNTFAQGYNMYNAIDGVSHSTSLLGDLFDDFDSDNVGLIVIGLVVFCFIGGILTTKHIMDKNKGSIGVSQEIRDSHAPIR